MTAHRIITRIEWDARHEDEDRRFAALEKAVEERATNDRVHRIEAGRPQWTAVAAVIVAICSLIWTIYH